MAAVSYHCVDTAKELTITTRTHKVRKHGRRASRRRRSFLGRWFAALAMFASWVMLASLIVANFLPPELTNLRYFSWFFLCVFLPVLLVTLISFIRMLLAYMQFIRDERSERMSEI